MNLLASPPGEEGGGGLLRSSSMGGNVVGVIWHGRLSPRGGAVCAEQTGSLHATCETTMTGILLASSATLHRMTPPPHDHKPHPEPGWIAHRRNAAILPAHWCRHLLHY